MVTGGADGKLRIWDQAQTSFSVVHFFWGDLGAPCQKRSIMKHIEESIKTHGSLSWEKEHFKFRVPEWLKEFSEWFRRVSRLYHGSDAYKCQITCLNSLLCLGRCTECLVTAVETHVHSSEYDSDSQLEPLLLVPLLCSFFSGRLHNLPCQSESCRSQRLWSGCTPFLWQRSCRRSTTGMLMSWTPLLGAIPCVADLWVWWASSRTF